MTMIDPIARGDPEIVTFRWLEVLVPAWVDGALVPVGRLVRPRVPMGYIAECTTANYTAAREPNWPAEAGVTVVDGSVIWTMRTLATTGAPTITSCVYTASPSGLTLSNEETVNAERLTRVRVTATTAKIGRYRLQALMTDSVGEDHLAVAEFDVVR